MLDRSSWVLDLESIEFIDFVRYLEICFRLNFVMLLRCLSQPFGLLRAERFLNGYLVGLGTDSISESYLRRDFSLISILLSSRLYGEIDFLTGEYSG